MNAKQMLKKSLGALFCLCLVSACGQQTAAPTQSSSTPQSSATPTKGQVAQPEIKPGKAADASALLVSFHGCADLLLSDGQQRKLGYDPVGKKNFQQIPGGIYDEGDPTSDNGQDKKQDCASDKTLQLPQPITGTYTLSIHNSKGRPFKLQITSYEPDTKEAGHFVVSQPAGKPATPVYQFHLPVLPGSSLDVKLVPEATPSSSQ